SDPARTPLLGSLAALEQLLGIPSHLAHNGSWPRWGGMLLGGRLARSLLGGGWLHRVRGLLRGRRRGLAGVLLGGGRRRRAGWVRVIRRLLGRGRSRRRWWLLRRGRRLARGLLGGGRLRRVRWLLRGRRRRLARVLLGGGRLRRTEWLLRGRRRRLARVLPRR